MEEVRLQIGGRVFILNNNSNKYVRAVADAGEDAAPAVILAHYDKLDGLIRNERGEVIKNGQYWKVLVEAQHEIGKLLELQEENDALLQQLVKETLPLLNQNVEHKRIFLGTLMTISAALIVGLFFLFSSDYELESEIGKVLAQVGAGWHVTFLLAAGVWLTAMLSQEGVDLDRRLEFYQKIRHDFLSEAGKAIRDVKSFREFADKKIAEEKKSVLKKRFDGEFWFVIVCALFAVACVPLVGVFVSVSF